MGERKGSKAATRRRGGDLAAEERKGLTQDQFTAVPLSSALTGR